VVASKAKRQRRTLGTGHPEPWPGVEFRHLAALAAVAEERSFNRAAARLGYTQSAISQQIGTLERAVGLQLVERRDRTRVGLTAAGEVLRRHVAAIASRIAAASADLDALRTGNLGPLRVGALPGLGASLLPRVLRDLHEGRPGLYVDLTELASARELTDLLEQGELDVVLVAEPVPSGPFASEPLLSEPFVLVVRESDPTPFDKLTLAELAELPLVGFRARSRYGPLLPFLQSLRLTPSFVITVDDTRTLHELVATGFGAAIVPRSDAYDLAERTRTVEVDLGLPERTIVACWHADRDANEAVRSFVGAARRPEAEISG
jgi:DNA-binding transcriptional LysR family regulator